MVCAAAGEKLIDHLKKWLEPEKLLAVQHSWDPGQECQIAAAILDLFHLLPPPAVKFLETQASSNRRSQSTAQHTISCFNELKRINGDRARSVLQNWSSSTYCLSQLSSSYRHKQGLTAL